MTTRGLANLLFGLLILSTAAAIFLAVTKGDVPNTLVTLITTFTAALVGLFATPPRTA